MNAQSGFYQLLANYLLCKIKEDFLKNKGINFNESDLILISGLVNGLKSSNLELSKKFRLKAYFTYLLAVFSHYFRTNTEETMYEIVRTLFNPNADQVLLYDFLNDLRGTLIKKIWFLSNENFFVKFETQINNLINMFKDLATDIDFKSLDSYSDDMFYEEVCNLIQSHFDKKSSSLIYEICNTHNFSGKNESDKEEEESLLIDYFRSFNKKRKYSFQNQTSDDEKSHRRDKDASTIEKSNAKDAKKQKLTEKSIVLDIQKENFPTSTQINQDDQEIAKTSQPIPLHENYNIELNFDEPTQSKIESTRVPSPKTAKKSPAKTVRRLGLRQVNLNVSSLESSTESELDFDESLKTKTRKSIYSPKKKIQTSSPKARKSVSNTKTNEDDSDSSEIVINRSKSKKKIQSDNEDDEEISKPKTSKSKPKPKAAKKKNGSFSEKETKEDNESDDSEKEKESKSSINKSMRKRVMWTDTETTYLVVGVELYEKGNWSKILKRFASKFNDRTSVHLKDKYRNIERTDELRRYEKQAKIIIERNQFKKDDDE